MNATFRSFRLAAFTLAIGLVQLSHAQKPGEDILILRDGSQRTGALQSCDGAVCLLGSSPVQQGTLAWIGLGRKLPTPPVRNATRHEVHLVNKTVATAARVTLNATHVQADNSRYPRAEVAWIHIPGPVAISKNAWKGRMEYSLSGEGVTFTGHWDVTVESDSRGRVKGGLTGEETHNNRAGACALVIVRKLTYKAVLAGKAIGDGGLALDIESETSEPGRQQLGPPCPPQVMPWGGPNPYVLYEPALREMLASLKPVVDGTLQSTADWRMPANTKYVGKAKITLRKADR